MSSNLKPWERARMGNPGVTPALSASSVGTAAVSPASSATQQQPQQTQTQTFNQPSSSSLTSFGYGSGYGTSATGVSSYGYGSSLSSGYGFGYGSSYGSSSGFSSYGASPYSSSFGYGTSSFMGPGMGVVGVDFQNGLIGNGLALINQVMEGFSRFSYLFGASFDAFRNAVVSLFGMYKGISPILGFAKTLTIFK